MCLVIKIKEFLMKKNFKECKEIAMKYSNGEISKEDFEKWSKENCEGCFFCIGRKDKKHCLFGEKL